MAETLTRRMATFVALILWCANVCADPPPEFLSQCKKETVAYKAGLAKKIKASKSPRQKQQMMAELKRLQKGKLVAPQLGSLAVGAIGRPRLGIGAAIVAREADEDCVVVYLPMTPGRVPAISSDMSLAERALAESMAHPGDSPEVLFKNASQMKFFTPQSGGKYMMLPETMEVIGKTTEGLPILKSFDLEGWAKVQNRSN